MKKSTNLLNLSGLDPAVDAAISRGDKRQAEAQLPKADRARLAKDRAKTAARRRFNMDLDPDLDRRLTALANDEHVRCPASGLANLAIALLLDAVDAGSLDLRAYLAPSKSPRYDRTVKLPAGNPNKSPPRGSP